MIISINRIFPINRIFFISSYSEKNKIQKNRQPYSLMPGPSMAVRPPQEQPLHHYNIELIEFSLLLEIFLSFQFLYTCTCYNIVNEI